MAIKKDIKQDDGIVTNYHRILFCQITTNKQNSISVLSYIDDIARENEKNGTIVRPYEKSVTYETSYDPNMTIETAYEYLKSLPEFEGAIDV